MKVALVTPTYPPYQGGIGNVAAALAQHLQQRGHQVNVLTPDYGVRGGEGDVPVRRLRAVLRYGNAAFVPQLYKLTAGADVINLHYPFFGGCEAILAAARIRRQPLVIHYQHDAIGVGFRRHVFKLHRKLLLQPLMRAASRVIVTSADYASHSQVAGVMRESPEKFVVVPNGVDTSHFCPGPADPVLLERLGASGRKVVLFVGALDAAHYFKGVNFLIQAFKLLDDPSAQLVIVGEGDLRFTYQELVKSEGLEGRVTFAPDVSYRDLPAYYRLARCTVLPSVDATEAFGVVLIESMACGTPLVASDLPGVRSVVGSAGQHGLLAKPQDAANLAKQIGKLLHDEDLYQSCSSAAQATAATRYAWPAVAAEVEAVYRRAMEKQ